jgi:SAM-dependent methyltransferase
MPGIIYILDMENIKDDKSIERNRYDSRSKMALSELDSIQFAYGSESMPEFLKPPYLHYENIIKNKGGESVKILELGSGSGLHTKTLLETGAQVMATDIAPSALQLLLAGLGPQYGTKLEVKVADMEDLPFEDESYDIVTSAGSLSYGDLELVTSEIKRVLKKGGTYICVDSYNHNPVYRLNRYIHYLRGARSMSTLNRMPDESTIKFFKTKFCSVEARYFGVFAFLGGPMTRIFGGSMARRVIENLDNKLMFLRKHSFKIVLVAQKD